MSLPRIASACVGAGALALAVAASGHAAEAPAARDVKPRSLAGRLLVAGPSMPDPRFARTVIYMVRHDAEGAMGLVVNRPLDEVPIALLLERLGLTHEGVSGSLRLHLGGPVDPGRLFVLHTSEYRGEGTQAVAGGIAVSDPPGVLRAIGSGAGPRRALLVVSYAGWGPGQLERELRTGGWIAVSADHAVVFDDRHETKWERALALREYEL